MGICISSKNNHKVFLLLLLTSLCHTSLSQLPRVTAPSGYTYIGRNEFYQGGEASIFRGIAYAEPPLGERRFRPSVLKQAPSNSTDEDLELESFDNPKACLNFLSTSTEDCLYLNIFTPADFQEDDNLPVLFYIHGGGFVNSGITNNLYHGRQFANSGVILVVVQFRNHWLGNFNLKPIFGSQAVADQDVNLALDDQRVALRWVQQNIAAFGGDPDNITIFGFSSGASFVMAHMASEPSKNLFHKAIVQSGSHLISSTLSSLISWYLLIKVILPIERKHKCGSTNFLDCFPTVGFRADLEWWQNASSDIIHEVIFEALKWIPDTIGSIATGPGLSVVDTPSRVLAQSNISSNIPLLIGNTMDEGYYLYPVFRSYPGLDASLEGCGTWEPGLEKRASTLLATDIVIEDPTDSDFPGRRNEWTPEQAAFAIVDQILFGLPFQAMLDAHKGPTYSYIIERPVDMGYSACRGAGTSHGAENLSIFGFSLKDHDMIEVHNAYVNFVKTGNPGSITIEGLTENWEKYDSDGSQSTMILSKEFLRSRNNAFGPEREEIASLLLFECALLTPFGALFLRPVCVQNPVISMALDLIYGRPDVKKLYEKGRHLVESR